MKLRKRGLQRIADKMGNRDYYTALQKSIIFFPNFLFSAHHLLLETRVSQYLFLYLLFCNDKIQRELHSFHYSSGPYEGRRGQAENSLLGMFPTTRGEGIRAMAAELHHIIPHLPTGTDTCTDYFHYEELEVYNINFLACCHNLPTVANYEYLGN